MSPHERATHKAAHAHTHTRVRTRVLPSPGWKSCHRLQHGAPKDVVLSGTSQFPHELWGSTFARYLEQPRPQRARRAGGGLRGRAPAQGGRCGLGDMDRWWLREASAGFRCPHLKWSKWCIFCYVYFTKI